MPASMDIRAVPDPGLRRRLGGAARALRAACRSPTSSSRPAPMPKTGSRRRRRSSCRWPLDRPPARRRRLPRRRRAASAGPAWPAPWPTSPRAAAPRTTRASSARTCSPSAPASTPPTIWPAPTPTGSRPSRSDAWDRGALDDPAQLAGLPHPRRRVDRVGPRPARRSRRPARGRTSPSRRRAKPAFDRLDVLHEHADGDALVVRPSASRPRRAAISADAAARARPTRDPRPGGTTYLCAVDGDRMGVSLIQSNAAGFGARADRSRRPHLPAEPRPRLLARRPATPPSTDPASDRPTRCAPRSSPTPTARSTA